MKKEKMILSLGISLLGITFFNPFVFAEVNSTNGEVTFEQADAPTGGTNGPFSLIKPGTYNEWITIKTDSGVQTMDSQFRFTFLPNFDFGNVKISAVDQFASNKIAIPYQRFNLEKPNETFDETKGEVNYLPPFLQVMNLRGTESEFKVTVSAGKFSGESSGETHILENTRIQIKDFVVHNNQLDKKNSVGDATTILKVYDGEYLTLGDSTSILATVEGKGKDTDASVSSLVFQKGFSNTENYSDDVIAASDSVRLFIPASDTPKVDVNYSTTITWSLEDAL